MPGTGPPPRHAPGFPFPPLPERRQPPPWPSIGRDVRSVEPRRLGQAEPRGQGRRPAGHRSGGGRLGVSGARLPVFPPTGLNGKWVGCLGQHRGQHTSARAGKACCLPAMRLRRARVILSPYLQSARALAGAEPARGTPVQRPSRRLTRSLPLLRRGPAQHREPRQRRLAGPMDQADPR